ncbi:MAG: hypothetical protein H0T56_09230, partial [Pseudaminobacter sp.]|nr:hypothetical protein [Pseudaminobacter sp.]
RNGRCVTIQGERCPQGTTLVKGRCVLERPRVRQPQLQINPDVLRKLIPQREPRRQDKQQNNNNLKLQ